MSYTDTIINAGSLFAYLIIFGIIFAESGLFIGFLLPGDSLLFSLGIVAAQGQLHIAWIIGIGIVAAVLGDSVGYATGRRFGPHIFNRPDSRFFKQENITKAQEFYEKYGNKTIVIARFTPIVRTFAPIVAGAAKMPYPQFLAYNVVGGVAWISSLSLLGYFLGNTIHNIDHLVLPIVAVIIILSLVPTAIELIKARRAKN